MRKRKPRTKNMYFTKIHEEAIIEYAKSDDNVVKTKLYSSLIQPAFSELVDKIVYSYKFNNLPNIARKYGKNRDIEQKSHLFVS